MRSTQRVWKREWLCRKLRYALVELDIEPIALATLKNSPVIYVRARMFYDGEQIDLMVPIDTQGKRLAKEISNHWIPGILAGTINHYDCLTCMLIFAHPDVIRQYRTRIKNHTGLFKDLKLRKYAIWKRITALEVKKLSSRNRN